MYASDQKSGLADLEKQTLLDFMTLTPTKRIESTVASDHQLEFEGLKPGQDENYTAGHTDDDDATNHTQVGKYGTRSRTTARRSSG